MAGPLPHSKQIECMADTFLSDFRQEVVAAELLLKKSAGFQNIFRTSLASDAVLSKILTARNGPPAGPARAIVSRVPILVCARQVGPCRVELRRFIELVIWHVYFEDHPVEWKRFECEPRRGFVRDMEDPIDFCAHRELTFYLNYAKSRMADEPSKIAGRAVDQLRKDQSILNADVHPTGIVGHGITKFPLDTIGEVELKNLNVIQRSVFSSACIVLAARHTPRFNSIGAMHRAHFDWLVGSKTSKEIRGGPFGL